MKTPATRSGRVTWLLPAGRLPPGIHRPKGEHPAYAGLLAARSRSKIFLACW
jgi:hypothetical protein